MAYSKYLNNPLDEEYLVIPGEFVEEGAIPPEEMDVLRALVAMKVSTGKAGQYGIVARLFRTDDFRKSLAAAVTSQKELMELVNRTPLHKAAIRRIVNAMPPGNGGREAILRIA